MYREREGRDRRRREKRNDSQNGAKYNEEHEEEEPEREERVLGAPDGEVHHFDRPVIVGAN